MVVQDFIAWCEHNQVSYDELNSAVSYGARRAFDARRTPAARPITPDEWEDLLDFVNPEVPVACPVPWSGTLRFEM